MLLDKIVVMGVSFITAIAVARYLGPSQMGVWGYTQSFSAMLAVFGTLGIQQIAIRDLVPEAEDYRTVLGSVIGLRLIGGVAIFLCLSGIALATDDLNIRWLLFLLGGTHIFLAFDSYDFLFQAKVLARYGVFVRLIWQLTLAGAKLTLVFLNAPLIWFGVVTLAAAILQAILFITFGKIISKIGLFRLRFTVTKVRYFLVQCWPLILSGLATTIYLQIDKVMLMEFVDKASVGYYSVASNIAIAWMFLVTVICQAFYPMVLRARVVNEALFKTRLLQLYSVSLWVAIALGALLALSAGWFVPLLLGATYAPAIKIVQVLSALGVFTAITLVSSFWLMAENLQKFSFYRNLFGMVVNILLNFLLIPIYGGTGAATASIIARASGTVGFMLLAPTLRHQVFVMFNALNPLIVLNKNFLLYFRRGKF